MTGNNKTPMLKHKLTSTDKERLHVLLRIRMIACGRREQVNRLVRCARRDSKILSREELRNKITPQAKAVVPVMIMREIMREMETCHGPKVIDLRPRWKRAYIPLCERIVPIVDRIYPETEINGRRMRRYALQMERRTLPLELAPQIEIRGSRMYTAPRIQRNLIPRLEGIAPLLQRNAEQVEERNEPQIEEDIPWIDGNSPRLEQSIPPQVVREIK